eukprot:gene15509-18420_t
MPQQILQPQNKQQQQFISAPSMINSGGNTNNMVNSGGNGSLGSNNGMMMMNNNNMVNSGGNTNNMVNSGGNGNLVNSGGKDNKHRWFPASDNDPFHAAEQENKKRSQQQYRAVNWNDASKYQEIVNTLNSPSMGPQGLGNMTPQQQQQFMLQQQQIHLASLTPQQQQQFLAQQQHQLQQQQQQLQMQQQQMGMQNLAPTVSVDMNQLNMMNQQINQQLGPMMNQQQQQQQLQMQMNQMNQQMPQMMMPPMSNQPMVMVGMMPPISPAMMQPVGVPIQQQQQPIPQQPQQQQQQQLPIHQQPPRSTIGSGGGVSGQSPSSSFSPVKPVTASLSPSSSLTGSLPNIASAKPNVAPVGVASLPRSDNPMIPPIPQHLQGGSSFANPTKHSSAAALTSLMPPPSASTSHQQQQFNNNSYSMQNTITTSSSSSAQIMGASPTNNNNNSNPFTFEQFIVPPPVVEQPKPTFSGIDEQKRNMEKYNVENLVSPPPQKPVSPVQQQTSPTTAFSEEEYKRQVEEKIRREVEERVRREYEEKAAEDRKRASQASFLKPQMTTTTSSTSNNSSTTTTMTSPTLLSPPIAVTASNAFPNVDLFADLSTTTTTSSSSNNTSTTTTVNQPMPISPSLRNPSTNAADKIRLKKELETIHNTAKKPAATKSTGIPTPVDIEQSCPICNQVFMNERVLAIHIDDWHKKDSVVDNLSFNPRATGGSNSTLSFDTTKRNNAAADVKPRSKTVSFAPAVTKDKKSASFGDSDDKRNKDAIKTTTYTTTTTSFSSSVANRPRADSTDLSMSFEAVFIAPVVKKPARVLTEAQAATILQSYARRWKARKEYKREMFRKKAVTELKVTELTYVDGLEKLIENFAFPLKGLCNAEAALISEEDVETIFGCHEIILTYNRELCRRIVERVDRWNVVQKLGDVLIEIVTQNEFKTIYNNFTLSYNTILSTLERLQTKNNFRSFLRNAERSLWTRGSATGTNLQSLLITPLQRITRYLLLLKEIIKHTKPSHPDYDSLCISLFEIQDICTHVNESQRREENEKMRIQTLVNIYNRIEPKPKDLQLVTEGRVFIREGHFSQYDQEEEKKKDRIFYLFNDLLLIAKESKKKLQLKNVMYLGNTKIRSISDGQKCYNIVAKNAFELHGKEISLLFTETPEEKDALLKELETLISRL